MCGPKGIELKFLGYNIDDLQCVFLDQDIQLGNKNGLQ